MARPRNILSTPADVSPGQAKWIIQKLISERRLSPGEVTRYVNDMQGEISSLERQLESLRAAHGSSSSYSSSAPSAPTGARRGRKPGSKNKVSVAAAPAGDQPRKRRGRPPRSASAALASSGSSAAGSGAQASGGTRSGAKAGRGRQRSAITPEQLASRQLQGRYLALIRQIPESRRGQYTKIAKDKGREAAIKEMQDVVKR
ncbi:MAG: hypothetical protein JWO56_3742 [Acidobacteria bacterium]|nr:hypothetical protein [Acidobacteriota bacterium]